MVPRPLAFLIEQELNKCRKPGELHVHVHPVAGTGAMSDTEREGNVSKFKRECKSKVPSLLVSTSALEEGIDVPDCQFVVRFDIVHTTKGHIQGSGRAMRHACPRVYYFDNDPEHECRLADRMVAVAKNPDCAATDADRSRHRQQIREENSCPGAHPFTSESGARVTITNSRSIVRTYIAKALGQNGIKLDAVFVYREDIICEFPFQARKLLVEMRFPTPDGWSSMTDDGVDAHFQASAACSSASDEDRMVYVVAVFLHKQGYLDGSNRPEPRFLRKSQRACPALAVASSLAVARVVKGEHVHRLGKTTPTPTAAPTATPTATPTAAGDTGHVHARKRMAFPAAVRADSQQRKGANEPVARSTIPPQHVRTDRAHPGDTAGTNDVSSSDRVQAVDPGTGTVAPTTTAATLLAAGGNYKGQLNEYALKLYNVPPKYETRKVAGGLFQAVARITPPGAPPQRDPGGNFEFSAEGESRRRIKDAEQSAAEALLNKVPPR